MIALQKSAISELTKKIEEIRKLKGKFIENCSQRVRNEIELSNQIQETLKNRDVFYEEVSKYDEMILAEIQDKRRQMIDRARRDKGDDRGSGAGKVGGEEEGCDYAKIYE